MSLIRTKKFITIVGMLSLSLVAFVSIRFLHSMDEGGAAAAVLDEELHPVAPRAPIAPSAELSAVERERLLAEEEVQRRSQIVKTAAPVRTVSVAAPAAAASAIDAQARAQIAQLAQDAPRTLETNIAGSLKAISDVYGVRITSLQTELAKLEPNDLAGIDQLNQKIGYYKQLSQTASNLYAIAQANSAIKALVLLGSDFSPVLDSLNAYVASLNEGATRASQIEARAGLIAQASGSPQALLAQANDEYAILNLQMQRIGAQQQGEIATFMGSLQAELRSTNPQLATLITSDVAPALDQWYANDQIQWQANQRLAILNAYWPTFEGFFKSTAEMNPYNGTTLVQEFKNQTQLKSVLAQSEKAQTGSKWGAVGRLITMASPTFKTIVAITAFTLMVLSIITTIVTLTKGSSSSSSGGSKKGTGGGSSGGSGGSSSSGDNSGGGGSGNTSGTNSGEEE